EGDNEATTRERIAATVAEYVPGEQDRRFVEPALLTLLGLEAPPPGGRDALFAAWRIFFEHVALKGTSVLVFEDLQWADSGPLDRRARRWRPAVRRGDGPGPRRRRPPRASRWWLQAGWRPRQPGGARHAPFAHRLPPRRSRSAGPQPHRGRVGPRAELLGGGSGGGVRPRTGRSRDP